MISWVAILVLADVLSVLLWRFYFRPYLMPLEGLERVVFVVWALPSGACLVGMAPSVVYWLPCLLAGLLLLVMGSWVTLSSWLRWRNDRILFRLSATRPLPSRTEPVDKAA